MGLGLARVQSRLRCGLGKGSPGDTWQVHWGSRSPNAEQLGPGCALGKGSDLEHRWGCGQAGRRGRLGRDGQRSVLPEPPSPSWSWVGGRSCSRGGAVRGHRGRGQLPGQPLLRALGPSVREDRTWCEHPLRPAVASVQRCPGSCTYCPKAPHAERALPCNFRRPCCQLGVTLPLPVSPGWADAGPGCSPGEGRWVSLAVGPAAGRFLPNL